MNTTNDRGPWLQTSSGGMFFPLDPRPAEITIEDIAHGLAHTCRFTGQSLRFYSVAEHCYLVSHACDPADALEGLFHDASEAYLGDMTRPLKIAMRETTSRAIFGRPDMCGSSPYDLIAERVEVAIAMAFGLRFPWPKSVHVADNRVLMAERRAVMPSPPRPWIEEGTPPANLHVVGMMPVDAKALFLDRFRELTGGKRVAA